MESRTLTQVAFAWGGIGTLLWLGGVGRSFGREPVVEAAGQPIRRAELRAEGMRFRPSVLYTRRGETTQVQVANKGALDHNLRIALPGGEVEFRSDLKPGETRVLQFTSPSRPGSYRFSCPVDDHAAQGMTGTLVVEP